MQKSFWRLFGMLLLLVLLIQIPLHPVSAQQTDTLTALRNTTIPPRDLTDLAQRLLGVTTFPNTPTAPKAYKIGDQEDFTAINNDNNTDFKVTEQLWYATPHVYMWFQEGYTPDMEAIKGSADHFEKDIYPTVRSYFGSEDTPGIDNDVHLYIVHAYGLGNGIAGYFESRSQYPKVAVPASNEHQMFFMNLDLITIGNREYESILAHEFQHMIHANADHNEQGWIDEGLSELASALAGYNDLKDIPGFASNPATQLNTWSSDFSFPHYGASYAFSSYFLQRFGDNALRTLVKDQGDGLEGFRDTLKKIKATDPDTKEPITVEDFFGDWVIANLLDSDPNAAAKFHYKQFTDTFPAPTMTPMAYDPLQDGSTPQDSIMPVNLATSQWGTTYLAINQAGTYHLKFEGQPTVKVVQTDAHSGKFAWWSTSFDRSDTKLTREFDLTKAKTATLKFALWYTIEKAWDYGYVMASDDGGKTWKVLPGQQTTDNRHNNPYGDGYTGYSGNADSASNAKWVDESVDLSAYAGKKIQIRFEYITDDSFTERGMMIDDVSIPEIGYSTDFESGNDGWQGDGFVRIDNTLPQRYLVQMVEYGSPIAVTRLLSPDEGTTGEWDITVGIDVSKVVLAISGMTEFTIEPAPFHYTLTTSK